MHMCIYTHTCPMGATRAQPIRAQAGPQGPREGAQAPREPHDCPGGEPSRAQADPHRPKGGPQWLRGPTSAQGGPSSAQGGPQGPKRVHKGPRRANTFDKPIDCPQDSPRPRRSGKLRHCAQSNEGLQGVRPFRGYKGRECGDEIQTFVPLFYPFWRQAFVKSCDFDEERRSRDETARTRRQ